MNKSTAVKKAKSAYKLAQILGISRQAVSKWHGQIPVAQEEKLMKIRPEWFRKTITPAVINSVANGKKL